MKALLLGSIIRHTLSALGGVGIGAGIVAPEPEAVTLEMVGGAIATLIAFGMSLYQKRAKQ